VHFQGEGAARRARWQRQALYEGKHLSLVSKKNRQYRTENVIEQIMPY
jgi:hypothetical protein